MLPPADLHTRCLRCGHDLGRDTRICPACGADRVLDIWPIVAPGIVVGVVLLALATVAHRIPFGAAVTATALFGAEWLLAIIVDPVSALFPGFGLAFRLILGIVLIGAVRSGWRARVLRSRRPAIQTGG